MKRIESYLENGMDAEAVYSEYEKFCCHGCIGCKYDSDYCGSCLLSFLMDEMPHDKTLLELFFERNPNAPKTSVGTPKLCPYVLGYEERLDHNDKQDYDCVKCWNRKCKDVIEGYEE